MDVDGLFAGDEVRGGEAAEGEGAPKDGLVGGWWAGDFGRGGAEGGCGTVDPEEVAVGVDGFEVHILVTGVDSDHGEGIGSLALDGGGAG